jgi:hypothetical protein
MMQEDAKVLLDCLLVPTTRANEISERKIKRSSIVDDDEGKKISLVPVIHQAPAAGDQAPIIIRCL